MRGGAVGQARSLYCECKGGAGGGTVATQCTVSLEVYSGVKGALPPPHPLQILRNDWMIGKCESFLENLCWFSPKKNPDFRIHP